MNLVTKSALALFAAVSISSVAMAAPGDASYGSKVKAQADVQQLESEIQQLGATPNLGVNLSTAKTVNTQAKLLNTAAENLQLQLNELKSQNS
ncbi:hypothetical protein [Marinomonas spartinae]|uniref:hypothetical protein n=1 Tax=Marinomonas spartinae TaxID=1792290 RepID=UPI0018F204F3|nr:hypothetical protein [Marinomonas spartinae]MBJ7553743.1 hypothetical protein [Marinomonas spartinae]